MKRILIIAITLVLSNSLFAKETSFDFSKLPTKSLQGDLPNLKEAKLVLLDFWASWCTPCIAALPYYDELQKKYRDQGVVFLSLSADSDQKDAEKFLKKVSFSFPAFWDEGQRITRELQIEAIPTLVALTPQGKVLSKERGYTEKKKGELPLKIEKWLKNQ